MVELVWGRIRPKKRRASGRWHGPFLNGVKALRWVVLLATVIGLAWAGWTEMQTSYLQSHIFSRIAEKMTYSVQQGPSRLIRFPLGGPYDDRLGYAQLPSFIASLEKHQFDVTRQVEWSPDLEHFVSKGGYAIYEEKPRAGLKLFDRDGKPLYLAAYPLRVYDNFKSIPPLVVNTLLFIEDRYLLDGSPDRNPAVEWKRFMLAVAGRIAGVFDRRFREGGASTLATQIEKFRHSPGGRTPGISEKLRQMTSASAKAYRHGRDTTEARQRIIAAYLNATPLGSWPGNGEVIGVPEAMWEWFGTDSAEAERILRAAPTTPGGLARKGEVYRQSLALLLSGRRPAYYLSDNRLALEELCDRYLRLLAADGVISVELRDAALRARLHFRNEMPAAAPVWFVGNKAADWLRIDLMTMLHARDLYALDRLDLTAYSTLDSAAQKRVTDVLSRLDEPAYTRSLGLVGDKLLGPASPGRVAWSVVLYERGHDRNYLRIHADSLNRPFDINSGAKLQLGSTAKLRTLVSYLDIIDELHGQLSPLDRRALVQKAAVAPDPLSKWAAEYLAGARDRSLKPMIEAAMQRRYSGSPETFFTGGGEHAFANFEKSEDAEFFNVWDGFAHSVNNVFLRMMRDVEQYYIGQGNEDAKALLNNPDDPQREVYLARFADQEGKEYLGRFYKIYRNLNADQALYTLAQRTRPVAKKLAVVFDTVRPNAPRAALGAFLHRFLPHSEITDDDLWDLYREYGDLTRFSLQDRGYIAGVHPLELWLVTYLQDHPGASRAEVQEASAQARQEVYGWLLKSHNAQKQNTRIRELLEEDAFDRIAEDWHRQGYPFARLTPSYATAIGVSGDRPDALANLMGLVVNGGVKVPTVDIERLHFAEDTPYETEMDVEPKPQRALAPEVADTVRRALVGVVSEGTARRLAGTYHAPDGSLLPVGGKTGTGDNRFDRFGSGGRIISQRVVDRTATFVFYLGDRYFGTITAYVPGAVAAQYHFTSALAVQLLKALAPQLQPLLGPLPAEAAAIGTSQPPPPTPKKPARAAAAESSD